MALDAFLQQVRLWQLRTTHLPSCVSCGVSPRLKTEQVSCRAVLTQLVMLCVAWCYSHNGFIIRTFDFVARSDARMWLVVPHMTSWWLVVLIWIFVWLVVKKYALLHVQTVSSCKASPLTPIYSRELDVLYLNYLCRCPSTLLKEPPKTTKQMQPSSESSSRTSGPSLIARLVDTESWPSLSRVTVTLLQWVGQLSV